MTAKTKAKVKRAISKSKTRTQWAAEICATYHKTVADFFKLGLQLKAAKEDLVRGSWLKMIKDDLPFTASTAQRLMKIAENPELTKAAQMQLLPKNWGTIYELTKLPAETFTKAAASGAINPQMTRDDVKRVINLEVTHRTEHLDVPAKFKITHTPPIIAKPVYKEAKPEEDKDEDVDAHADAPEVELITALNNVMLPYWERVDMWPKVLKEIGSAKFYAFIRMLDAIYLKHHTGMKAVAAADRAESPASKKMVH